MREHTATSNTAALSGRHGLWCRRSQCWKTAAPVPPLRVKNIGSGKAKKEIEDCHHCAELRCAVLSQAGIVDGKDDDVKEDADGVDDQGQEDGVLAVWESNAPDESAKEQQVVDDICQFCPSAESGPRYQQEVKKEQNLQSKPGHLR